MFILQLNMMRDRYERLDYLARSATEQGLLDYLASYKVDPYTEDGPCAFGRGTTNFRKNYRKGSPLEWYNPPDRKECIFEMMSREDCLARAADQYDDQFSSIPEV